MRGDDGRVGEENGLDKWYPGDDYVDYIGTDFYDHGRGFNSTGTPAEILDDLIGQYDQVCTETKPYFQNEIGSVRGSDRDRVIGFLW